MHAGQHPRLGGQLPDVGEPAAVDAAPVGDDPLPDQLLGEGAERAADLVLAVLELAGELLLGQRLDPVGLGVPVLLAGDRERGAQLLGDLRGDGVVDVLSVVGEDGILRGLLGGMGRDGLLRLAERLDERLRRLQALGHGLLGRAHRAAARIGQQAERAGGGLCLHHHDGHVAVLEHPAGHDHVEGGIGQLRLGGERDPLALDQRNPDAADRPGERQAGELGRERGRVDRDDVVQVLGIQRHDRLDDLHLIAQPVHE